MKEFEQSLKDWEFYLQRNRQIGHTIAAINGVKNIDYARLICVNAFTTNLLAKKCKTINFNASINSLPVPVVFDNATVHRILIHSLNERIDKKKVENALARFFNSFTFTTLEQYDSGPLKT